MLFLFFGCGSETVADAFLTSADVFGPSLGSVVGWIMSCVYSLVNLFLGMLRAILVNYARFIRDIHRDTFEIWEIHVRFTRADLLGCWLLQVALSIV